MIASAGLKIVITTEILAPSFPGVACSRITKGQRDIGGDQIVGTMEAAADIMPRTDP